MRLRIQLVPLLTQLALAQQVRFESMAVSSARVLSTGVAATVQRIRVPAQKIPLPVDSAATIHPVCLSTRHDYL
jgi:hypothetical protein